MHNIIHALYLRIDLSNFCQIYLVIFSIDVDDPSDSIIENNENPKETSFEQPNGNTPSKRKRKNNNDKNQPECDEVQTEEIHKAVAIMIAMEQLPLSFCRSKGFQYLLSVIAPGYKVHTSMSLT